MSACTAEEVDLLKAHEAYVESEEQAELTAYAEAERDAWFDRLRAELDSRSPAIHRND